MPKRFDGNASFSDKAFWIAAEGAKAGEWFTVRGEFEYKSGSPAVLLLCAADGAEVYLNGRLAHRAVIRSYMFDAEYEALDISDSLKSGKNKISLLFRDTGERCLCGVIFEIICNNLRYSSGDSSFPLRINRFERLKPGIRYFISNGCGIETYDENRPLTGKEYALRKVGPLIHAPTEAVHRSRLEPQTEEEVFPESIRLRERWTDCRGFRGRLSTPEGYADVVYFSVLKTSCDTPVTVYLFGKAEAAIDGKAAVTGSAYILKTGRHTVAVSGGSPSLFIKTDAAISPWRYAKTSERKAAKRRYPWNDPAEKAEIGSAAKAALQRDDFEDIQLYNADVSPLSEEYLPRTRRFFTAEDGLTPAGIEAGYPREVISEVGISDKDGVAVVAPSQYGAAVTFDFGSEQVGYPVLKIDSPNSMKAEIHLFEAEDSRGEKYVGERNEIIYITKKGSRKYVSHCRRGFRYMKVFLPPCDAEVKLSAAVISSRYGVSPQSYFSCSDSLLNRVFAMSCDTAKVCMLDRYVDCPGYEQNVWTGDARITALINLSCFGKYEMNAEYLELIAQSLSDGLTKYYRTGNKRYINKLALSCAAFPTYPDGNIPIWSFQWILSVFDHYLHTGDAEELKRLIPAVEETFARAEKQFSPRGLFAPEGTWNLIEWANNDLSEYGEVTANNMMLSACYTSISQLENALGRRKKAKEYREKGERLKDLINRYCFDEKAGQYVDTVRDEAAYSYYLEYCRRTEEAGADRARKPVPFDEFSSLSRISVQTATFAVLYGIAEGERLAAAKKLLTDNVSSGEYVAGTPANRTAGTPSEKEAPGGIVKIGSPFFMFFALDALYKTGEYGLAELAMRRDWGEMLKRGISNCTETFISKSDFDSRSTSHGWSASPAYFLAREALGVVPLEPGFKKFTVRPRTASLNEAAGSVMTPQGEIFVKWTRTDGGFSVEYEAPDGLEYIQK